MVFRAVLSFDVLNLLCYQLSATPPIFSGHSETEFVYVLNSSESHKMFAVQARHVAHNTRQQQKSPVHINTSEGMSCKKKEGIVIAVTSPNCEPVKNAMKKSQLS